MNETLLIRADAGPKIGIGHVMRCVALGQAWQAQGGAVAFALASVPGEIQKRLDAEGFAVTRLAASAGQAGDAAETAALARSLAATCIVLDGYHFGAAYRQALAPIEGRVLMVVDGVPEDTAGADFVLDQNLGASRSEAMREKSRTRFLLGPRFALLRREFWGWRGWKRLVAPTARKLLVTLGGSDPDNLTVRVVRALRALPEAAELDVRILAGPANPHRESLESEVRRAPEAWQVLTATADMPELISWADLGISAGGSTCWELAFLGLPFLTIVLAENQRSIAANLSHAGVSRDLGWHEEVSSSTIGASVRELIGPTPLRLEMSRRGQETVDGFGAERVAGLLTAVAA